MPIPEEIQVQFEREAKRIFSEANTGGYPGHLSHFYVNDDGTVNAHFVTITPEQLRDIADLLERISHTAERGT